jgi:hypothetical protein
MLEINSNIYCLLYEYLWKKFYRRLNTQIIDKKSLMVLYLFCVIYQ